MYAHLCLNMLYLFGQINSSRYKRYKKVFMQNYKTIPVSKNTGKIIRQNSWGKSKIIIKSWLLTNFPYLYFVISYFDMCTYPYRSWENMHMRIAVFDWLPRWRHWVDNNKVVFWLADFCLCTFGSNHLVNQKGHSDLWTELFGALQVYNSFLKFFVRGVIHPKVWINNEFRHCNPHSKPSQHFFPSKHLYFEAFVDVAKRSAYTRLTSNKHLWSGLHRVNLEFSHFYSPIKIHYF